MGFKRKEAGLRLPVIREFKTRHELY